jgi:hypothetical protein
VVINPTVKYNTVPDHANWCTFRAEPVLYGFVPLLNCPWHFHNRMGLIRFVNLMTSQSLQCAGSHFLSRRLRSQGCRAGRVCTTETRGHMWQNRIQTWTLSTTCRRHHTNERSNYVVTVNQHYVLYVLMYRIGGWYGPYRSLLLGLYGHGVRGAYGNHLPWHCIVTCTKLSWVERQATLQAWYGTVSPGLQRAYFGTKINSTSTQTALIWCPNTHVKMHPHSLKAKKKLHFCPH